MKTARYLVLLLILCTFGALTAAAAPAGSENASTVHTITLNQTDNLTADETTSWLDGTIKLSDRSQTRLIITGIILILFMQALILVFLITRRKQHRTFILKRKET